MRVSAADNHIPLVALFICVGLNSPVINTIMELTRATMFNKPEEFTYI